MPWATAAATFNLLCSGMIATTSLTGTDEKPFEVEYRLDLNKKLYCEATCPAHRAIVDIQPVSITLDDKKVDTLSEQSTMSMRINREDGSISGLYTYRIPRRADSILMMKWTGKCEKRPFSGFPAFETKF